MGYGSRFNEQEDINPSEDSRTERYIVTWDNGHASGELCDRYATKRDAEMAGRDWKADMVAADDDPREARRVYQWEVREEE